MAQKVGFKHKEESKKAISEALKGEKNPMYGIQGEAHPSSKLSINEGLQILKDLENGISVNIITKKYSISRALVYQIKHGKHWINRMM